MSSSNSDRKLCKTCNIWISSFPANVTRHEASDIHKGNIKRMIRQADEIRKKSQADESDARNELERVTRAALGGSHGRPSSHPLGSVYDLHISRAQKESEWIVCRTDTGRMYYTNRITGESQFHKPVELGGVGEPASTEPKTSNAPPRPRTVAKPPPRPRTDFPPKKTIETSGDSKLLDSLILPSNQTESPQREGDLSTGFGEWEAVDPEERPRGATLDIQELKESKRPLVMEGQNVGFNRTVTKKNKRTTREED
jgi:hypothetical protein